MGSEWVVDFRVLGRTWRSRSTVEELDRGGRRFACRSGTDDGCDPHPVAFWRRLLLVRVRARQLARTEIPASLAALAAVVTDPAHHAGSGPVVR